MTGLGAGDRRSECRYRVDLPNALLGWQKDSSFTHVPVRLVSLSLTGCLVEMARIPGLESRQSVWVNPNDTTQSAWIEGHVASMRKRMLRNCEVRIKFLAPLGYEPFKTLVYGADHLRQSSQRSTTEHEWDQFWK
jgi:hypothetical protein